jgi:hypothetical protein
MGSSCSQQRTSPAATTAAPIKPTPRPPRLSLDSTSTVRACGDDGACTVTVSRSDGNASDCGILELSPQRGPSHRTRIVSSPLRVCCIIPLRWRLPPPHVLPTSWEPLTDSCRLRQRAETPPHHRRPQCSQQSYNDECGKC